MDKLGINLGFLLLQIANFAIIFIVMRAWVYNPMLKMLEKRRTAIAQGLEDARVAAEARANAERDAEKINQEAQLKTNDVLREANARAETVQREAKTAAEAEVGKLRTQMLGEVELERNRMLGELRQQVIALSMAAAQKLIGESLTQERQRALVNEFFSGVKGSKVQLMQGVDVSGGTAEVTSALPLTADEQAVVKKDMAASLGSQAEVSFKVDPSILGGLVVRVGDRVVDGSVAGQLSGLRQSL